MAYKGSLSVAQELLRPVFDKCSSSHDSACINSGDAAVLRRAQLRIAASMLAEIPYTGQQPPHPSKASKAGIMGAVHSTQDTNDDESPRLCPVDSRCSQPLALGGIKADLAAENAWYTTHAHCLMCNVHNGSPCAAPYFAYNAHRDVVDAILKSSPRRATLEHAAGGRLRAPLGCQSTVRTWIDMFLSTAVSSCHSDNIADMFSDSRFTAAEVRRDGFQQAAKAAAGVPAPPAGGQDGSATSAPHTPAPVDAEAHFGAVLRRAHRDLLVDMSVLEAVRGVATAAAAAAAESKEEQDVLHRVAEDLAPFAKTQMLTTCASLVDVAAALRDMLDTRKGVQGGRTDTLQDAYAQQLHAALGDEAEAIQREEETAAQRPVAVMHGMPKPSCGVWLEADGTLHAPKPCFQCPASEKVLVADIAQSLHELLELQPADAREPR